MCNEVGWGEGKLTVQNKDRTVMRCSSGGVEISKNGCMCSRASGASLRSSWDPEPNSQRVSSGSTSCIYAPLGFMACFSSCQHFLVVIGLINTVNVHPVLWRCPCRCCDCCSHTPELCVPHCKWSQHHVNHDVVFLAIAQLLSWLETD